MLTRDDIADRHRYLNARNTLNVLLKNRIIPIINENDTVAFDEIKFGENDSLAALVGSLIDADLILILSDIGRSLYCRSQEGSQRCINSPSDGNQR